MHALFLAADDEPPLRTLYRAPEGTARGPGGTTDGTTTTPPEVGPDGTVADRHPEWSARELTRMVEAERLHARALAAANTRLRMIDQIKSDFLTFISLELRAARASLDPSEAGANPDEHPGATAIVQARYERLSGVVGRGLEYLDWLAGACAPVDEITDLAALVPSLVGTLPALGSELLQCRVVVPAGSCRVRGGTPALATCVETLLDNARRFSPPPARIAVGLTCAEGRAVVSVTDHGKGFPPARAQELFRPFAAIDTLPHGSVPGLSLALAAAIVQAHGGSLRAASAGLDQGATFTLELPLATV